MPYTIIDHTADIGVRVNSPTIAMLFKEAAFALADILGGWGHRRSDEISINARGIDLEDLLVRWLQEILYLIEVKGWRPVSICIEELSETEARGVLEGACTGEPLAAEVKAVTYHNLKIVHIDNNFEATIILDM